MRSRLTGLDKQLAAIQAFRSEPAMAKAYMELMTEKETLVARLRGMKPLALQLKAARSRLDRATKDFAELNTEIANRQSLLEAKRALQSEGKASLEALQSEVMALQCAANEEAERALSAAIAPRITGDTRSSGGIASGPRSPVDWALGLLAAVPEPQAAMLRQCMASMGATFLPPSFRMEVEVEADPAASVGLQPSAATAAAASSAAAMPSSTTYSATRPFARPRSAPYETPSGGADTGDPPPESARKAAVDVFDVEAAEVYADPAACALQAPGATL